jgi:hypothetical protein
MAIGFSGLPVAQGLARGKRHGSKQIWTVRSHRDRWQPVGISRIGVSGNRELSAHCTWKCRSTKLRSTLRTKPRVSAPGHIKRAGKGGDNLFIIVNNIWAVHLKDARHVSTSCRRSGIRAVRSPHHFTPRNPESRSSESAQSRAHGFGAWSSRRRSGRGALSFSFGRRFRTKSQKGGTVLFRLQFDVIWIPIPARNG